MQNAANLSAAASNFAATCYSAESTSRTPILEAIHAAAEVLCMEAWTGRETPQERAHKLALCEAYEAARIAAGFEHWLVAVRMHNALAL